MSDATDGAASNAAVRYSWPAYLKAQDLENDSRVKVTEGMLPLDWQESFHEYGYLLIDDFFSESECKALATHIDGTIDEFVDSYNSKLEGADVTGDKDEGDVVTFSASRRDGDASEVKPHDSSAAFFRSGSAVSFFPEEEWEKHAQAAPDGRPRMFREAINKIGHAMHDVDPVYSGFVRRPALDALCKHLGVQAPQLVQSMVIYKPPHIGGAVEPHQDATFLVTDPVSVMGLWVPLDEATVENGCLWVCPGGHREALRARWLRDPEAADPVMRMETDVDAPLPSCTVPVEVKPGALLVIHGLLPHASKVNSSAKGRRAYSLHVVNKFSQYHERNWLQRPPDMQFHGFEHK